MRDPLARRDDEPEVLPGRKLAGRVTETLLAPFDHFETRAVPELRLSFAGIEGDLHAGLTRRAGGREPWYPRGTEMRNARQLSIVAGDELARIAAAMGLRAVEPHWLGANLVIDGVPALSMLPAGTLFFFSGGATLKVDGQNAPCRVAGRAVAGNARMADREAGALLFARVARRLRGLVAWVEKPGTIAPGEAVSVRVPEQWIYRP